MKKLILTLIAALLMAGENNAAWFDNGEKDRRIQAEQQLASERQSKGDWQIVAGILGIGAVILFTVGTALGSKIRRDAAKQ